MTDENEKLREALADLIYLCETSDKAIDCLSDEFIRIKRIAETMNKSMDSVTEVVKNDDSEMQSGDYTNPILIPEQGIIIVKGLWYYVTDKDLPHEAFFDAFVTRDDFNDKRWFDFV